MVLIWRTRCCCATAKDKHGTVDPVLAKAHMGRDVFTRLRRSYPETGSQSPGANLSIEGRDAYRGLYRIYQLSITNWHSFKGYGRAKHVIIAIFSIFRNRVI